MFGRFGAAEFATARPNRRHMKTVASRNIARFQLARRGLSKSIILNSPRFIIAHSASTLLILACTSTDRAAHQQCCLGFVSFFQSCRQKRKGSAFSKARVILARRRTRGRLIMRMAFEPTWSAV